MLRVAALAAAAVSVEAQFLPAPGTVGGGSRTITYAAEQRPLLRAAARLAPRPSWPGSVAGSAACAGFLGRCSLPAGR